VNDYFALNLLDGHRSDHFDSVTQLIASDDSGSFGILAGHARIVAVLRYGLVRFVDTTGKWRYISLPGGVLSFGNNQLNIMTVRYFLGDSRELIIQQLAAEMSKADSDLHRSRATLEEIEHSLVRRLGELSGSS
jgi:F-type H+-transporting ATPase subunit epsilon